jgi:serine/threonine protein kinase
VYLATRVGRSAVVPALLCVKVSQRIDGWLREAYFGQVLDGEPRAIRIYDAFPLTWPDGSVRYCLALEYARHGDLRAVPPPHGKGWPESRARREIAGVLEVLVKLHRGQLLHRDLTPLNVFVCEGPSLKLGDFGLVRHQSDRRGASASTLNPLNAPSDILAGAVPKWQARDDVYQVGQLLGMLVKGSARVRIRTVGDPRTAVQRPLEGDRAPLHRRAAQALRERRRADRRAAHSAGAARGGVLRTLRGVHLAFTGILRRKRREAAAAARAASARSCTAGLPCARASSCAAARTRCRPPAATGA